MIVDTERSWLSSSSTRCQRMDFCCSPVAFEKGNVHNALVSVCICLSVALTSRGSSLGVDLETGTSTLPWQFRFYFDKSLQKLHFGKRLKEDIDDTLTSSLIVLAWSGLAEAKIAEHAPLLDPRFLNRSIHGRSVLATVSYKFREVWS